MERKKASRYLKRCDVEKDLESEASTTRTVPLADDEISLDPSISELELSNLANMPITRHLDSRNYRDRTESRQHGTLRYF
jgi:hypothetical protein